MVCTVSGKKDEERAKKEMMEGEAHLGRKSSGVDASLPFLDIVGTKCFRTQGLQGKSVVVLSCNKLSCRRCLSVIAERST